MARSAQRELEDLERRAKALRERQEKVEARRAELEAQLAERREKGRNHALMTIGGLVVKAAGGDWTRIDFDALAAWLSDAGGEELRARAVGEKRSPEEAAKALRAWQRHGQAAKVRKKPAKPVAGPPKAKATGPAPRKEPARPAPEPEPVREPEATEAAPGAAGAPGAAPARPKRPQEGQRKGFDAGAMYADLGIPQPWKRDGEQR